jgi:hypothetical protein
VSSFLLLFLEACFLDLAFRRTDSLTSPYSELSRLIATDRLHCSIDKVHGVVETTRPGMKAAQYETVVRQGDVVLNAVQRLSKVLY